MEKNRRQSHATLLLIDAARAVVEAMESRILMTAAVNGGLERPGHTPTVALATMETLRHVKPDVGHIASGKVQSPQKTASADSVPSGVLLNEIEANPPGTADNRYEYVEISGSPGQSLGSVYFVTFDGTAGRTGIADLVVNLSSYSLGSDGLLVIQSSAMTGHAIPAATTLVSDPTFFTQTGGFVNGSLSFFLYYSPNAAFVAGKDYDTNDDGTLDHLPSGAVSLDDVAVLDTNNTGSDIVYGSVDVTEEASLNLGTADAVTRFPGNAATANAAWYGGELVDTGNVDSQIDYDATREAANEPANAYLTPGAANYPFLPVFNPTSYSFDVQKTAGAGTAVGTVSATVAGTDTLAYSLSGAGGANFVINGSGAITVAGGAAISGLSYSLTVTAKDNQDGATSTAPATIAVFSAPVFNPTSYAFSVQQTAGAGAAVGTVSAAAEGSDALTYSLSGAGNANFVVGASGAITVAGGAALSGAGYNLTVTATDIQNNDAGTAAVAISVVSPPAPTLLASQVGNGSAQRSTIASIAVTFSEAVNFSSSSFTLYKMALNADGSINAGVAPTDVSLQVVATSTDGVTWTIAVVPGGTLDRTATTTAAGFFTDGIYQLVLHGAQITDAATKTASYNAGADEIVPFNSVEAGGASNYFHVLFGDVNGDGSVNGSDYFQLKQDYLSTSGNANFSSAFDYNGDGSINGTDYFQFKRNYLVSLVY